MKNTKMSSGCEFTLGPSPIGWIGLVTRSAALIAVDLHPSEAVVRERIETLYPTVRPGDNGVLAAALNQLREYFAGERRLFDLPLELPQGSPFFAAVLLQLSRVPYGETVTYGELATAVGRAGAARAVGRVMAANPLPLIVPCHRVVGTGGRMTGYSGGGGVATKEWLLRHEKQQLAAPGGQSVKRSLWRKAS